MKRIYELVKQNYKVTFAKDELDPKKMFIDMRKGPTRVYATISLDQVESFENAMDVVVDQLIQRIEYGGKIRKIKSS